MGFNRTENNDTIQSEEFIQMVKSPLWCPQSFLMSALRNNNSQAVTECN